MLFRYESLASVLACVEAVAALYSSDVKISPRDFDSRQTTSLGAITVRSAEQKRGLASFKPDLECTHHYADRTFCSLSIAPHLFAWILSITNYIPKCERNISCFVTMIWQGVNDA